MASFLHKKPSHCAMVFLLVNNKDVILPAMVEFESFLYFLQYEKCFSTHTLLAYSTDLQQFAAFLHTQAPELSVAQAQHMHIRAWVLHLMQAGIEPRSVNRKTASLRAYYKFLQQKGLITQLPTAKLRPLKTGQKLPAFVKETEIAQLFAQVEAADTPTTQLIIEVLYGTGIRLAELIHLKVADADFARQTLKVLGKGKKVRYVPMLPQLTQQLKQHVAERKASPADNLLVTPKGKKLYPMFVYRAVRECLMLTSADKKSPHVLRHTFATHLLNNDADLNAIKELLGHTSLATTQVYTHHSLEKLKAVYNQAHPKSGKET